MTSKEGRLSKIILLSSVPLHTWFTTLPLACPFGHLATPFNGWDHGPPPYPIAVRRLGDEHNRALSDDPQAPAGNMYWLAIISSGLPNSILERLVTREADSPEQNQPNLAGQHFPFEYETRFTLFKS